MNPNNISTPRDLLKISIKALKNEVIREALSTKSYTFNRTKTTKRTINNVNELVHLKNLNYDILASKTGYLDESGAHLFMLIQSKKDKKQYVVLTMGEKNYKNRFIEPNKIATWISKDTKTQDTSSVTSKKPTTSKPTGFQFTKDLKIGVVGEEVRQLQSVLKKLGYFKYPSATGKYADMTKQAVIMFQKANGIKPLGIVGPATRDALNKVATKLALVQ